MNKNRRIVVGSLLFRLASPSCRVQRLLTNTRQPLRTPRPNHYSTTSSVPQTKSHGETHVLYAFKLFSPALGFHGRLRNSEKAPFETAHASFVDVADRIRTP